MAYKRASSSKQPSSGYSSAATYRCPETPRPPQSYRDSAPDSQMPPSESQMVNQRKQLAGTK